MTTSAPAPETIDLDRVIDIDALVEAQPCGAMTLRLLLASMLISFFDGFDLSALSFSAPYLAPELGIDRIELGYIFSLGLAGTLLGAFLTGILADRYGRRPVILLSGIAFGLLTLNLAVAHNFHILLALRFVQGVALGGILPLCWTLNIDYTPKRRRATIVTLITIGFGVGTGLAGPISVVLIPLFGWHSLFIFGGLGALLGCLLIWKWAPESLRYAVASNADAARIGQLVKNFVPEQDIQGTTRYIDSSNHGRPEKVRLAQLFTGGLRFTTPLVWTAYFASSLSAYLLASWGPVIYEAIGFERSSSAFIASFNTLGGISGGLMVMRFTDRFGAASVAVMPFLAVPLLLTLGLAPLTDGAFLALVLLLGTFLIGGHYGVMSVVGLLYPASIRATGTGTAAAIAKLGSIAGPLVGGILLSSTLPPKTTFAFIAVCPLVLFLCMIVVAILERRPAQSATHGSASI